MNRPTWLTRAAWLRWPARPQPDRPVAPVSVHGDWLVRWCTVLAVVAVAGVAAYISYWHAVEVVTHHGERAVRGHLYPVVIDGIIVAASMVVLDAARHREAAPKLAWSLLLSGIGVTLAANVAFGVTYGLAGALWAAWPALAFVGCYELLMMLVRASARRATASGPDGFSSPVPSAAETSAEASLRATLAAGNPWSLNQLADTVPSHPRRGDETAHPRARRGQRARTRTGPARQPLSSQQPGDCPRKRTRPLAPLPKEETHHGRAAVWWSTRRRRRAGRRDLARTRRRDRGHGRPVPAPGRAAAPRKVGPGQPGEVRRIIPEHLRTVAGIRKALSVAVAPVRGRSACSTWSGSRRGCRWRCVWAVVGLVRVEIGVPRVGVRHRAGLPARPDDRGQRHPHLPAGPQGRQGDPAVPGAGADRAPTSWPWSLAVVA